MPVPATFAAATVALTAVLLYLTHRSRRTLDRVRVVDRDEPAGSIREADATAAADAGPPRTFDHPDAIDRDFHGDPPVANAAEPFADESEPFTDEAEPFTDEAEPCADAVASATEHPGSDAATDERPGDGEHPSGGDSGGPVLTTELLLANVAVSQSLALGALVVVAWWTGVPASAFGLASADLTGAVLLGGLALGIALYLANEAVAGAAERVGVAPEDRLREAMAPSDARGWALLLGVVLPVIAVFEEALFRGALIGVFAFGFGIDPWLLAVGSSVAFGLGHGAQGRLGIAVTGLLGFALAAVFVLTGSLLLVIVAHYVVNALEFLVREGLGWDPLPSRTDAA
ncbi:CPBP family intramembrane metalloprotease [Halorubrum sp. JWXQ-INN 858]|uniref:CPBP family intramembrane glutamic endopeptidase n=1 Tax=Halorubrum sp. JWXQ-INN 858 TaxID=2690782 RepID=UPI00135A962D|nr:CPBP family intramembrane glutamic endopeptidase [Halorubrum sp. JWXQ-INN 858]MWV63350.1 CPBP family intramembrane metalloprotease [Halorubrum sp. JWXQ-INN 858]